MLLDAQPPKPRSRWWKFLPAGIVVLVLIVAAALIFWNYPEERAVETFLTTVQAGNYEEAYRLWQPSPSYSYQDFLHDWGVQGDYGKIRQFQIVNAQGKGSELVIVTVRINNQDPPLQLAVDRKTKGLAYSVF